LGSQLIAKRYHQIYKSIRKDLIYLVSDIFKISFNFNPFFPNIQSVMISPLIKNHRNNDLSASLFLELAYGISHSHNHLLLSTYDSHFLLEYVVDCLFEKHSDPKRANIILQILSSFFKFYKEKNSKLLQLSKNVPQIISHLIKNANFLTIDIHVLLEFTLTISCFSTQNELNCGSNGNLLLSLIMKFSTKKSGFAKKHENELVKAASNLIQHSKELPQAVLVSLLSWQFNLSHDHLRSKIYESLTNIGFLDTCVLEVLHNLNSWSNLGDENGPDVTLRCSTLRKIDSNFLQKYNDKQSLVYLIFLAALKSFLSCSNHYLTSDSFCCFLDLSFPVIKSFGGFYYDKIYFYLSGSCKKLLHSKEEIQFQSGICLLHGLTRNHMFESLHAFLIDSDVFVNLSHIQISLRMAGLNQLKSVIASLPIDKPFIEDFLLPIVLYFLNCITSANNKAHNLTTEAISVLSVIVRKISWNQYLKLIKIYINNSHLLYDEGLKLHKLRTRILSAILENFSFQISETSSSTCVARAEVVNLVQQLVTKLYSKPIGEENKELVPSFTELNYSIIKAPLSLVIIHLLKLLNDSTINSHVRGIISHLVEMLASPHKDMRISARSILAKSVKVLGPGYFKIVLNEMYATLKDGFQKHVFTYTAHHIMSSLSSSFSEDINDSIGILIEAIISDHFGAAYEERQVHAITSKTKEAYTGKGFNISQFLGSHVQHEKIYNFLSAFSKLNTVMNSYSAIKICIESPFIQVAMKSLDCLKLMLLSDNEEVINQVDELLQSVVGRQAALETMTRVLTKIKQKRWSKYNDDIFIRIIELLTNDDDEDTRNIAYSSLKILIAQSSENAHQKYIKLSLSWLSNLKLGLMETGCLVIHALLEHQESFLGLHSHSLQLIFDSSVKFFEFVELQQESNSQNTKRGFEIIGYKLINLISEIHYKTKFSSIIWVPLINQIHILIDNSIELSNSYLSTLTAHEKGLKLLLILTELFVGLSQISQSLVDISLDDLFKRLVKCSNIENQLKSNKIRCRLTLLKWIAAVVVFADKKSKIRDPQKSIITIDINFLNDILYIINRELFSKKKSPLLNSTAKNVLDVLKKSVNPKLFLNAMNNYKTLKTRDAKLRHSLHVVGKAKDPKKYHQSKIRKRLSKSVNKRFENSSKLH
ncbi:hypothetical protein MXB_3645, partial [Myxobolus squamalis]